MKPISRRKFVQDSLKVTTVASLGSVFIFDSTNAIASPSALQFAQIALPYAFNSLEPYIDTMTMEIHYGKHHAAYVKNVNEAITAENITFATEKDFFANASKLSAKAKNNGGGVWNHNFFWTSMKAGTTAPAGKLLDAINANFTSVEEFKKQFAEAGMKRFGSGWAWLVSDNGKLKIGSTANQDNPLMDTSELKGTPLLALDVWEHAYYLKYQNKRADYISGWWNVVNWEEVGKRLG